MSEYALIVVAGVGFSVCILYLVLDAVWDALAPLKESKSRRKRRRERADVDGR